MLKQETWDVQVLDAGFAELTTRDDPATMKLVQVWTKIRDPFNQSPTEPVPLNGNGQKLAPGKDPVFLRGVPGNYQLQDFNLLMPF
jgi:hypothetical protein